MTAIQLELEDDLAALLGELDLSLARSARELMVLELFRRGTLTSGRAAQLLGMDRWDFVRHASHLGIAYFALTEQEWQDEVEQAQSL